MSEDYKGKSIKTVVRDLLSPDWTGHFKYSQTLMPDLSKAVIENVSVSDDSLKIAIKEGDRIFNKTIQIASDAMREDVANALSDATGQNIKQAGEIIL